MLGAFGSRIKNRPADLSGRRGCGSLSEAEVSLQGCERAFAWLPRAPGL